MAGLASAGLGEGKDPCLVLSQSQVKQGDMRKSRQLVLSKSHGFLLGKPFPRT